MGWPLLMWCKTKSNHNGPHHRPTTTTSSLSLSLSISLLYLSYTHYVDHDHQLVAEQAMIWCLYRHDDDSDDDECLTPFTIITNIIHVCKGETETRWLVTTYIHNGVSEELEKKVCVCARARELGRGKITRECTNIGHKYNVLEGVYYNE